MIPLASAMRLHSSLFRNAGAPSCHFFSSIRPSVVSLGPGGHKLYCRNLLAGEIQKSFNNAGTILFYLMGRGGSSWSSRVGSYHGFKVKCTRASSEESKALQKFALCLALAAMLIKAQLSLEPASASHFVAAIPDVSILMSGSPVTDPNALLRYALPIDNKPIRDIQKNLENITGNLKVPGVKALKSAKKNIEEATLVLNQSKPEILADIAESKKENGRELVDTLILGLQDFQKIVEAGDRDALASKQKELLNIIGQ